MIHERQLSLRIESSPIQEAVVVILVQEIKEKPQILVAKRKGVNQHTLPGGKVEPGETFGEAAIREMLEELGPVTEDPHQAEEFLTEAHPKAPILATANGLVRLHLCFAWFDEMTSRPEIQSPEPDKHGPWRWIPLEEVTNLIARGQLPLAVLDDLWLGVVKGKPWLQQWTVKQPISPREQDQLPSFLHSA